MNSVEAQQQARQYTNEARALFDKHGGELDDEQQTSFDELIAKAEQSEKQGERLSKLEKHEGRLSASAGRHVSTANDDLANHCKRNNYSVVRALNTYLTSGRVDGVEAEANQEIARKNGKSATGFWVPFALDVSGGTGAIGTELQQQNMIELLRKKMLSSTLGVRILSGVQGKFALPRQSGGGTAYWVAEATDVTLSSQTFDSVSFTPATMGASTVINRAFAAQSTIDAESFVRDDLMTTVGLELDRVIFDGSGAGAQPQGILGYSSVPYITKSSGALTWADILAMEARVANANADVNTLHFVTTPGVRGMLKATEKASNTAQFIWGQDNNLNGYSAYVSNQMPSTGGLGHDHSIIFGNFADAVLALFGNGFDVVIDPYTLSQQGGVKVTCLVDAQFKLRHPESFVYSDDVDVSGAYYA